MSVCLTSVRLCHDRLVLVVCSTTPLLAVRSAAGISGMWDRAVDCVSVHPLSDCWFAGRFEHSARFPMSAESHSQLYERRVSACVQQTGLFRAAIAVLGCWFASFCCTCSCCFVQLSSRQMNCSCAASCTCCCTAATAAAAAASASALLCLEAELRATRTD